jgi:hypothetical protein
MNLTDKQWAAWTDKRPHFKPRTAAWLAILSGVTALFCAGATAALVMQAPLPWHMWLLVAVNGTMVLVNGAATLRNAGVWRAAKIRESCPVPEPVASFLLATRVDHYLQLRAQRRAAWASLRRQVVGR